MKNPLLNTAEGRRMSNTEANWRRWGPYVSDRQWGTVREDYSADADPWRYFPHDHARSRAYRWGEDAIAGFSDERALWCLGLALWNGHDPFIKERLFGLTNAEGNHGEDVKELYFYTDATPTHSYLRMSYRYPQAAFPYAELIRENHRRDRTEPEYEILDTRVFDDGRWFEVTVEYAKAGTDDILMRITVHNHADEAATLHVLPQLTARNTWSWFDNTSTRTKPQLQLRHDDVVEAIHPDLPLLHLRVDQTVSWLFCENETNVNRLYGSQAAGPFKDGIDEFLVQGNAAAIRDDAGTKCAALVNLSVQAHETTTIRLRFCEHPDHGFSDFDAVFAARIAEADEFYSILQRNIADADARRVQRQAFAGLIWSKQYYEYDVRSWLNGDPTQSAPPPSRKSGRNADWQHISNADIISMPDKWEYPWYASWDLGFHAVSFALLDPAFAKSQICLLLGDRYMHPNGQIPAYEWNFGDANPPVQAWAAWRVFEIDRSLTRAPDHGFLRQVFNKLLLNFGWWINRKDARGLNIFQGGFLGLDNIEIFDRSMPLPTGGQIDQVDGTAWMASFALHMMRIALELATVQPEYQDIAIKFFEHFLLIAEAMSKAGGSGLWDDQDDFFYDLLRLPSGAGVPLRVRSVVGLSPLIAVQVLEPELMQAVPEFARRLDWFLKHRPDLASLTSYWNEPGHQGRRLLALLRGHRTKALLARMLDETEFLSPFGVRSVSKFHKAQPYVYQTNGQRFTVDYEPAESTSGAFGGNSNWRGPVWLPLNYLFIEALLEFHRYYGDDFIVEYPHASKHYISLADIAAELTQRLTQLCLRAPDGTRPVMAAYPQLRGEDHILFHEYFDGNNGRGAGASHQTGWTALMAILLDK